MNDLTDYIWKNCKHDERDRMYDHCRYCANKYIKQLSTENERLRSEKKKLIEIAKDYHSYLNRTIKDWEWARLNRIWECLKALEGK